MFIARARINKTSRFGRADIKAHPGTHDISAGPNRDVLRKVFATINMPLLTE